MAKMGGSLGNKPSNCVSNRLPGCNSAGYDWGSNPPPGGSDNSFNEKEDFAESVTAYVYPNQAKKNADDIIAKDPQLFTQYFYYSDYTTTDRWKFVDGLIAGTLP